MKRKIILLSRVLILIGLITSCSSNLSEKNFDELDIKIVDVQSWLNLMPGGPGSFHISGKYELPEELDEREIFLYKIIVIDNDQEIYNLIAELQFVLNSEKGTKEFVYTSPYQTKIIPILMERDSIDVQLVFSVNGLPVKKDLNKIPLTRAY
ncbi:MAG: hypothetical protein EHM44_04295 [Ignavibacteriales bacterium]|nr:MAG: hypothetical protein EHM44_04295 [Ignavibacteriales bacterium]